MKPNHCAIAAAIALSACVPSAFASATATARLDDLKISLAKLDAAGPDPTATFTTVFGGSYAWTSLLDSDLSATSTSVVGGGYLAPVATSAIRDAESASASIAGEARAPAGATAGTSAHATGDAAGLVRYVYGGLLLGDDGADITFTLGANTLLEISAQASVSAEIGPAAPESLEFADALVDLQLSGTNGTTTQFVHTSLESTQYDYYGALTGTPGTLSDDLALFFAGSRTAATTGTFSGRMAVTAMSAVPVPEPTSEALLLAGLGALALRRRVR